MCNNKIFDSNNERNCQYCNSTEFINSYFAIETINIKVDEIEKYKEIAFETQ